ncbi:BppU family phage baseplate upper protein [Clostridium perfringens]
MKEIFINVDAYNSDGIKTIQGNNNAEVYKIYVLFNKRRIDLTEKTVKMAYLRTGTVEGDVINLNVTNATEGEITLQITNAISKKDGVYSCQLAICNAVSGFKEHTATFGLTVEANIFTKIAGEIENSKDLTYIERILEEATNVSEELKSNIPVARQLNSDLENQNRILNENMDRANGVNNTLITTTEQSKVAATDAIEKKSQLESSIVEAKKFIDGLDGSQNIPQLRLDVTELQNGLKSNQALSYEGSSISAENTLEGRTEGMSIKGLTLQNLWKPISIQWEPTNKWFNALASSINFDITGKVITVKNITNKAINFQFSKLDNNYDSQVVISPLEIKVINVTSLQKFRGVIGLESVGWENTTENKNKLINGLIVCIGEHSYLPNTYFEGLKSFGEAEQEGDKYKIKLLSKNKNFFNKETDLSNWWGSHGELHKGDSSGKKYSILTKAFSGFKYIINVTTPYSFYTFLDNEFNVLGYGEGKNTQVAPVGTRKLLWYLDPGGIDKGLYNKIQVEPGTKSTEYQSYQEDKKDILISAPLRSVYDVQDIMYEDNGQVKVNRIIGEHLVTGDENFITELRNDYLYGYFTLEGSKAGSGLEAICNQFKYIDGLWNKDNLNVQGKEGFDLSGSNSLSFQLPISRLETTDTSGLKKYFKNLYNSNNPVIVYYQLATPVTEIVENCVDIDLDTYQEKTYFSILNSLPGTLDFKVPSNIGSSLQKLAKEVNNIWDVINNLLVPGLIDVNKTVAMATIKNNLQ